jgi:hypothetical protein
MSRKFTVVLACLAAVAAIAVRPVYADGPSITYTVSAGTPGNNGWYLSDVTAQIQVSVAPGTNTTCPAVKTFQTSADALDCSATVGNSSVTFHLQFKIDKDAPIVTGSSPDRAPNGNGWYNAPVTVSFTGTDATSGIASCTSTTYNGPDSGTASVSGTCTDVAGNTSAPSSFGLKYDATPPTVTPSPARTADANGWYNHAVAVAFSGSDPTSGIDSCTSASYSGPDAAAAAVQGTCTDKAGNSASASFSLQYDSTPPGITTAFSRPPDVNGWYNHPVTVTATGTDTGSGIESCSSVTYSGPDDPTVSLTASCVDKAGNKSTAPVSFKYDSTPPKLSDVTVANGNGTATLRWAASPGVTSVTIKRTSGAHGAAATVYKGDKAVFTDARLKNGIRYRYQLSATDAAGNVGNASASALPRALETPGQGQTVKTPPLLRWATVGGADYYNVQLFFRGRKVLSMWPVGARLALQASWTYAGKPHELARGTYRWYVWPGYGARKTAHYGKLLGSGIFVVK